MIHHYVFGAMPVAEAKTLDNKVVSVHTWADEEMGEPERHFSRVRAMLTGHTLLLLADDSPGPPDEVDIDLIRTVEVHPS